MQTERFTVNPAKVVHETIEGEAIVIQLDSGFYYSLQGIGAEIWGLAADGRSPDEIARALEEGYEAERPVITREVQRLVAELVEAELLEPSDGVAAARGLNRRPRDAHMAARAFHAPVLTKYTDMQDFLLVDPIHQTSDAGWPERRGGV